MDKLQKLKEMLTLLQEGLTRDEFTQAFKAVTEFVKREFARMEEKIDAKIARIKEGTDGKDGKDGRDGKDGKDGKSIQGPKGDRGERGPQGIPGFAVFGAKGKDGKDGSPDTPEQVRDKLETLQADERLDKSAIKGLEDEIKALRKELATKTSGGVRRVFQPYVDDFSSQTNGSLKIFTLSREPLKTNTILVWGSDFPIILRPNTDFTVSGKTLTLTSAVPAPNSGATLLVMFHS